MAAILRVPSSLSSSIHGFPLFSYMDMRLRLAALQNAGAPLLNNAVKARRVEEQLLTTTRILLYADSINPRMNALYT